MAVKLMKRNELGPGVRSYDFEVRKDTARDAEFYNAGRALEIKVSGRIAMKNSVEGKNGEPGNLQLQIPTNPSGKDK